MTKYGFTFSADAIDLSDLSERLWYINSLIKPILNIYTTGLAYPGLIERWNKYINDWLYQKLSPFYLNYK